ncbi:MAG: methyl-accepting chemotaxis protein [Candidatus Hodarchaeales archaeon]|jgi:methyl-accepting chemotaxis protein
MTDLTLIFNTTIVIASMLTLGNIFFLVPMYLKYKQSIIFRFTIIMMILVDYVSLVLVIISLLLFDNSEFFIPLSVVLYGFGILLSIGLVFYLSKSVIFPLNSAVLTSEKIGLGILKDLDISTTPRSDEIGILMNSHSGMLSFLRPVISSTEGLTMKLVSASHDLASSSEQVNASSEELSAIAQQIAKLAQDQAKQVELSMGHLKNLNQNFHEKVKKIDETSSLITSIQEEINILSLNASIEAVRAGDYGRGFAVVAQSIKKLSEDTKSSIVAIEGSIKDLTVSLTNAIENLMDNFYSLSSNATEYSTQSEEAGAATEEQSASLEEITATAQDLASLSNNLRDLTSKFQI